MDDLLDLFDIPTVGQILNMIFFFEPQTMHVNQMDMQKEIQSNSVITNITGPSTYVRYNREFVITVNIYVVKWSLGAKNGNIFCSL